MPNGRAFEDVVFAVILGVWSIKVEGLWKDPASIRRPVLFLVAAAMIAVLLRLLWEIPGALYRLLGFGWLVLLFMGLRYIGVWAQFFSPTEGWIFWLVLVLWGLTVIFADWTGRLVHERFGA